jgi:hypothetical protein
MYIGFKPRNIFSVMNIDLEEHKKAEEQMPFSCSEYFYCDAQTDTYTGRIKNIF